MLCRAEVKRALVLAATLALTPLLPADVVTLSSGRTLEGEVVHKDAALVVVRLASGANLAISPADIVRVDSQPLPETTLDSLEKKLPPRDAKALIRLARWCDEQQLPKEAERLCWQALELDQDESFARRRLGFVRNGDLWLTENDLHCSRGEIFEDGAWTPLASWKEAILVREGEARLAEAREAVRRIEDSSTARNKGDTGSAFEALPRSLRLFASIEATESPQWKDRLQGIQALKSLGDSTQTARLVKLAVEDEMRTVRDSALRTLKSLGNPDVALSITPYLRSADSRILTNAANALSVFPDRHAVPQMVELTQAVWAGFGRVHMTQIVQRAYVQDYELVSGGTGNVVQEVADPVVGTFQEGVVLDVQVNRVLSESTAIARALQHSTGRTFGMNFPRWKSWWDEQAGKKWVASR